MNVIEWLKERHANCIRIAAEKLPGEDRMGWEKDAAYFELAIQEIEYYREAYARKIKEVDDLCRVALGHRRP